MGQNAVNSKSTQKNSLQMILAVMGMGLSFIADVYVMINFPYSYIAIGIISVIFLGCTFLLVQAAIKLHFAKLARQEEVYDELFKSSKATYLMMRKSFGDMEDTVNNIGEVVKAPIAEFMDEQKNISQITVNRSKENADALMNSNDKLLDKFFEFETTLEEFEEQMISKQKELMDSSVREITMKQQELSTVIKDSELEIKKEMLSMGRPMSQMVMQPMEEPVVEVAPIFEEVLVKEEVPVVEEVSVEEEAPVVEEVSVAPISSDPNKMMSPDDIAALLANMSGGDVTTEEPVMEETSMEETEDDPFIGFEEAEEDLAFGFDEPMEEIPIAPAVSDPNKMMSPDDIAALIASMGGGDATIEEPVIEEVKEEPKSEDKPPMPDLSDPNKMMSPEDIAALLANL